MDDISWTTKYLEIQYEDPFGCFFMVAEVLREEFNHDDIPDYTQHDLFKDNLDSHQRRALVIQEVLNNRCKAVPLDEVSPGDVIPIAAGRNPIHVGIYAGNGWFLHCTGGVNTILSRLDDLLYKNRIHFAYQVQAETGTFAIQQELDLEEPSEHSDDDTE